MRVSERFKTGISRYKPSDADALAEFQREAFGADGRQLDQARFTWLYERNPCRLDDQPGVWICRREGTIVGQQAEIAFDLQVGGERRQAAWAIDLMVDPAWRVKGIGPGLVATHLDARDLVTGLTQSDDAAKLYERMGWTEVGTVPIYQRPLDVRRTLRLAPVPGWARRVGWVLGPALRAIDGVFAIVLRLLGLRLEAVDRFDDRVDEVWERAAGDHPVLACRDAAHVRWRFDECPEAGELQRYYLTRGGRTLGYVVLQPSKRWDAPVSLVIDYLAPARWVAPLLVRAAHEARRQGAFTLVCRTLNQQADRRLRLALFVRRGTNVATPLRLVARCAVPADCTLVGDANSWLLTAADSDLS